MIIEKKSDPISWLIILVTTILGFRLLIDWSSFSFGKTSTPAPVHKAEPAKRRLQGFGLQCDSMGDPVAPCTYHQVVRKEIN